MKKVLLTTCLLVSALALPVAHASADENILPVLPAGAVQVTLSEEGKTTVDHDRMRMTLRAESDGATAEMVQNRVNQLMQEALRQARRFNDVKTSTGQYSTYQHYKDKSWKARQSVTIEGADSAQVLKLGTALQNIGLVSAGMSYYLSDDKAAEYRNELITQAVDKIKERADLLANRMGKSQAQVITLNIGGQRNHQPMMARHMMADSMGAESAPVAGQGGEEDISVNINAMVYLLP